MKIQTLAKSCAKAVGLRRPIRLVMSPQYRYVDRLARPIQRSIRARGLEGVRAKHAQSNHGYKKYLHDFDWHLEYVVQEALLAGAVQSPPLRVLDIGCGPGYFLYALRSFGHDVLGLDIDDTEIFNDLIELLKIPRVVYRVEAMKPLPNLGAPFDLITALGIAFDLHRTENIWGPREWEFLLNECCNRLRPGGRIFLRFNPATTRDFDFVPDDVAAMLRTMQGGELSTSKEFFMLRRPA